MKKITSVLKLHDSYRLCEENYFCSQTTWELRVIVKKTTYVLKLLSWRKLLLFSNHKTVTGYHEENYFYSQTTRQLRLSWRKPPLFSNNMTIRGYHDEIYIPSQTTWQLQAIVKHDNKRLLYRNYFCSQTTWRLEANMKKTAFVLKLYDNQRQY